MISGGALKANDPHYLERESDYIVKKAITDIIPVISITGPHQSGKSSLLIRCSQFARKKGYKVIFFDLQNLGVETISNSDLFTSYLIEQISIQLNLDFDKVQAELGASHSFSKFDMFLGRFVLGATKSKIIIAFDEADRLLQYQNMFHFFSLCRSWDTRMSVDKQYEKLTIVTASTTNPYNFISDYFGESPFNIGLNVRLKDFDENQILKLSEMFSVEKRQIDFNEFSKLLGGHPFLSYKAFELMSTEAYSWHEFTEIVSSPKSPFYDHLNFLFGILLREKNLRDAFYEILKNRAPHDHEAINKLDQLGLITKFHSHKPKLRCGLYKEYFEEGIHNAKEFDRRTNKKAKDPTISNAWIVFWGGIIVAIIAGIFTFLSR
jgi:hypothetical protein